jgi:hypothetical protein
MPPSIEDHLIDLPTAAAQLGRSADSVRRMLARRPDIDARIRRRWGNRLLSPADVLAVRAAFEEREAARPGAK